MTLGHALDVVHAELLPEDKARIIEEYKKEGPTAMIGDGINDAPALATADIGISMGISGSALAMETGHMILMSNNIQKIPLAIKLARRTLRKLIENVIISITTKGAILALAFAAQSSSSSSSSVCCLQKCEAQSQSKKCGTTQAATINNACGSSTAGLLESLVNNASKGSDKREIRGCCKQFAGQCCGKPEQYTTNRLSEIVIE
ncbi:putative cadmium/zinc-transporting atpase hma4 [Quercus suber]|uniref:Cadmium/zinc-transporting atpase hma4 n=1 Tax=Quercus suber TaxID=58331 RepID=A0AAW0JAS0_QUESU